MNTHRAVIESSVPPMLNLVGSGPKDFCEQQLAMWIAKHPLGEFEEGRILRVEPQADHHQSSLPSDTYGGPLTHNLDVLPGECPRCIADRAVEDALEGSKS